MHAPTRKVAIGAATFVALTLLTGVQYLPSRLHLSVGGVSPRDIVASLPGPSRGCWRRCSPPASNIPNWSTTSVGDSATAPQ